MKYRSVFDIIGPVMIGPSSSHTAGAARIGRIARQLFGRTPLWAVITLYGSFAATYKGHGTDVALVGGLLDYATDDPRIEQSFSEAEALGLDISFAESKEKTEHPNTVRIRLGDEKEEMELTGVSVGGGKIEIIDLNGFSISSSGRQPTLFVIHDDQYGAVATVASILAKYEMNISHMEVSRKQKGKMALMVIETDQDIPEDVVADIITLPYMFKAAALA